MFTSAVVYPDWGSAELGLPNVANRSARLRSVVETPEDYIEQTPPVVVAPKSGVPNLASPSLSEEAEFGGKGIRTPGLLIANETLYQLSYTPI
jgi:hypothetical protein